MEKTKYELGKAHLEKTYGKGTIIGGNEKGTNVNVVSTGSLTLDIATGIGGLPYGRVVEIRAPESAGKTSLCLHIVANAQKQGKKCIYIDTEHSLDLGYAQKLGVNIEALDISQPDYGEQAFNIAKTLAETGEVGVIIIDSVAALVPKAEYDGEVGDANVGRQSRLMSQALRMLVGVFEKNNVLVVMPNQIRMKIGAYGNPEVGTGGEALKYYSSIILDMRKSIDTDNQGNKTKVKVIKNKMAAPFKTAEFFIEWNVGIDRNREILDLAIEYEIIKKAGAWITLPGIDKPIQGEEKVLQYFLDNPDYKTIIENKVMENINY